MRWCPLLLLLPSVALGQGVLAPAQPRQTTPLVVLAAQDLKRLPYEYQIQAGYLMLDTDNVGLNEVEEAYRINCGHVHHLSNQPGIAPLKIIPGSQGRLWRLFKSDYGWSRELWEKLADVSPQTHIDLDVREDVIEEVVKLIDVPKYWGMANSGRMTWLTQKYVKAPRVVSSKVSRQRALAPWLAYGPGGKEALADLVKYTQSKVPIVDARWFFNQSAIQADRHVGYYDWLGIADEAGFRKLIGFDEKISDKFGADLRGAQGKSGVTKEPRGFSFKNATGGGYRRSFDFEKATDKKNPLRVQGKDIENHYDATEQFGVLSNGFFATGLFAGPDAKDAAGKPIKAGSRANFAPPEIASNRMSRSNDTRVHINAACWACHQKGGVQSLDEWWRNLATPPVAIAYTDPVKAREARAQYGKSINGYQDRERKSFSEAVQEATGWDADTYLPKYWAFWESYEDAHVDLGWLAREMRVSEAHLKSVLSARLKSGVGRLDEVLGGILKGQVVGIRQAEEVYPILKEYLAPVRQ